MHMYRSAFSTGVRLGQAEKIARPSFGLRKGNKPSARGHLKLLIVPGIAFALGTWQVYRREWKLKLIYTMKERTTEDPIPFPDDPKELNQSEMEFRPVKVVGTFDHSREVYISPRTCKQHEDYAHAFPTGLPQGVNVVTAFKVKDKDVRIMVNRGWVPYENVPLKRRKKSQLKGEQTITGIVRRSEKYQINTNIPEKNVWFYRDLDAMGKILNAKPYFLDLVEECTPEIKAAPVAGQTRVDFRNEHGTYVFIWYSLAVLGFAMWHKRVYGRFLPHLRISERIERYKAKHNSGTH